MTRRKHPVRFIRAHFQGTPPCLEIQADPNEDWRARNKGHSFSGGMLLDGLHDQRLRISLSLLPRRHRSFNDTVASFRAATCVPPLLIDAQLEMDGVTVKVEKGKLTCRVPAFDADGTFSAALNWTVTEQGKPMVYRSRYLPLEEMENPEGALIESANLVYMGVRVDEVDGVETDGSRLVYGLPYDLELQLLVVVQPPTKKPDPLYFEWQRRFFPGGLPSLGKRRRH